MRMPVQVASFAAWMVNGDWRKRTVTQHGTPGVQSNAKFQRCESLNQPWFFVFNRHTYSQGQAVMLRPVKTRALRLDPYDDMFSGQLACTWSCAPKVDGANSYLWMWWLVFANWYVQYKLLASQLEKGMVTGETGPRPAAQTHGLCSDAEFQPHVPPICPQFFISNYHRYGHGWATMLCPPGTLP